MDGQVDEAGVVVGVAVERQHEQRFLFPGEVETLAGAGQPRYRALVLVGAYGGLRFGELAALRRSRVDILRGRVTVAETLVDVGNELSFGPPKTRSALRTVPLPRLVVAALDDHLSRFTAAGGDALVFTGGQGGPLRRSRFRARHWVPATRAAGLAGLRFHDLRHTFVALTIAAGADPKRVSVRAGHSSVAFTLDRYGHLYESDEDDLTMRLDALLEGTQPTPDATVVSLEGRS